MFVPVNMPIEKVSYWPIDRVLAARSARKLFLCDQTCRISVCLISEIVMASHPTSLTWLDDGWMSFELLCLELVIPQGVTHTNKKLVNLKD